LYDYFIMGGFLSGGLCPVPKKSILLPPLFIIGTLNVCTIVFLFYGAIFIFCISVLLVMTTNNCVCKWLN